MLNYIVIGLGGAIGSILRAWLSKVLLSNLYDIPVQIIIINIAGCFMMGLLTELMSFYWCTEPNLKSFLTTGFLGGFTTFSTFSLEAGTLIQKHLIVQTILYVTLSVIMGLFSFFLGIKIIKSIESECF